MIGAESPGAQIACVELVELLTAYLDGALSSEVGRHVDDHLAACQGCRAALAQWRTVVDVAGRLSPRDIADLDPYIRDRFLTTLRTLRRR